MTKQKPTWKHSSASQVSTFRQCPRRWWWQKVAGYTTPPSEAMKRGTAIHAELEAYLKEGTLPTSAIALAGLEYLPPPTLVRPVDVERAVRLEGYGLPVPLIGYIDLVEPPSAGWRPRITDHKTTSNFKYIKEPDVLAHDPQAIIYSAFAFRHLFTADDWLVGDSLTFRHVYYRTSGRPDSRESLVHLSRSEVDSKFKGIVATVEAQAAAREKQVVDLEPVLTACGDYGGCPFITNCNNAGGMGCSASVFAGLNDDPKSKGRNMGLLEKIKARKEAKAQEEAFELGHDLTTINPPDGTPMDQLPEEPVAAELPLIKAPTQTPISDDFKPDMDEFKRANAADLLAMHSQLVSGLADDLFQSWQAVSCLALWHAEGRSLKRGEKPKKPEVIADMEWLTKLINEGPLTVKEAFDLAMDDKLNPPQPEPEPKPEPDDMYEPDEVESACDEDEHDEDLYDMPPTLYIGCIPRPNSYNRNSVGKMVWLEDYLKRFQEQVAESRSVPHYRLVEYAAGEKEVAALVHHNLRQSQQDGRWLPNVLIADRRVPGANAVLEVLVQHYPHIVERLG